MAGKSKRESTRKILYFIKIYYYVPSSHISHFCYERVRTKHRTRRYTVVDEVISVKNWTFTIYVHIFYAFRRFNNNNILHYLNIRVIVYARVRCKFGIAR